MTSRPSEHAAAALNMLDSGDASWDDSDVKKILRDALIEQTLECRYTQRSFDPEKAWNRTPSATQRLVGEPSGS